MFEVQKEVLFSTALQGQQLAGAWLPSTKYKNIIVHIIQLYKENVKCSNIVIKNNVMLGSTTPKLLINQ